MKTLRLLILSERTVSQGEMTGKRPDRWSKLVKNHLDLREEHTFDRHHCVQGRFIDGISGLDGTTRAKMLTASRR